MVQRRVSSTRGRCPRCLMASTSRRVEYSERLRERMTTVFLALGRRGGAVPEADRGSASRVWALSRAWTDAFLVDTFLAGMGGRDPTTDASGPCPWCLLSSNGHELPRTQSGRCP